MSTWNKIMECVPNFSEGRDLEKIDKIVAPSGLRRVLNCWTIVMTRITIAWLLPW